MDLSVPSFLPNGESLWIDADFNRRLHWGDASIGWNGDPTLAVYHEGDRLVIVRWADGHPRPIMRSKPGHKSLDTATLAFLAAHDSQRRGGFDPKAYVDGHNARINAARQAETDAKFEEAADKLHWALRKDIGAHEGGSRHRLMSLPAAPWKKDDDA